MNLYWAIFAFETRANARYLLASIAVMLVLPILLRFGLGHQNIFVTLATTFGVILGIPFAIVGQDRMRRTIGFLVDLPISTPELVFSKFTTAYIWSFVLACAAALPAVIIGGGGATDFAVLAAFDPAIVLFACSVLCCAYFLFDAAAVARGFALVLLGITIVTARFRVPNVLASVSIAELMIVAYAVVLCVAVVSFLAVVRFWKKSDIG